VSEEPRLALIAAVARNGIIGDRGALPWRLSTDLKRFKELTVGKPVVMGRRTFLSLKKPLADRLNVVTTRDAGFRAEGAVIARSLDAAIAIAADWAARHGAGEIMVVGGAEIYRAAIEAADRLYITHVEAAPSGDASFPPIDPAAWRIVSRETVPAGEKDSAASEFVIYDRVDKSGP
jgi:dihydrofolate reductase